MFGGSKYKDKKVSFHVLRLCHSHFTPLFLIISAKDETKGPLVIPLNQPSNEIIDRIKESRAKRNETTKCEVDGRPDSELTLDELAARELLRGTRD